MISLDYGIKGFLSWVVIDKNKKIKKYSPSKIPNLITKSGLNSVAEKTFASLFHTAKVGESDTEVNVSQTSLSAELSSTSNHIIGENGYIYGDDYINLYRSWEFPPVSSFTIYREVGFSSEGASEIFSRILIGDISIQEGDSLSLRYDLIITFSPSQPIVVSGPSFLSPTYGGYLQFQLGGLMGINSDGSMSYMDESKGSNEPSVASKGFISNSNLALSDIFESSDRSSSENSIDKVYLTNYKANSFFRDKIVATKNNVDKRIRSPGVGTPKDSGLVVVFDNDLTVNGIFSIKFRYKWAESNAQFKALSYWRDPEESDLFYKNPLLAYYELK
jgi:hypothetical protein